MDENERFQRAVIRAAAQANAGEKDRETAEAVIGNLMMTPGIWEVLSEEYNNEALSILKEEERK